MCSTMVGMVFGFLVVERFVVLYVTRLLLFSVQALSQIPKIFS
jgi:hypothetical protein